MSAIGPELPPHLRASTNEAEDDVHERESIGPQIPSQSIGPHIPSTGNSVEPDDDSDDDYGPALPPSIAASRTGASSSATRTILGPSFPPAPGEYDSDDDDDVGPQPLAPGAQVDQDDAVKKFIEIEERRRKDIEESKKPKAPKRDEWMLVPPSSSDLLGNIDPTKMKARQFARSKAPAPSKDVDNSLWTETPAERQQRVADEVAGKKRKAVNATEVVTEEEAAEARKRLKRDEQIRKGVDEHTRKSRGVALVDAHSATLGSKPDTEEDKGIWDHSRDMGLGGRLLDDSTRAKMLNDAKGLGSRFSTGKSGGFL